MVGTTIRGSHSSGNTMMLGVLMLGGGLALNYVLEHHNIFKILENSPYSISWADIFYPPLCVFLSLTGVFLVGAGAIRRTPTRTLLKNTLVIAIPLTILYTLFVFAVQFIQTGADRLGECPGFKQAASSTNVIPESKSRPGHSAVGCSVQRRGIFLSYYNDMSVYGVTDPEAQQRILDKVAEHFRQARTHPVQVIFYENENWSVRQGENGVTFEAGGPSKPIRVVNIG